MNDFLKRKGENKMKRLVLILCILPLIANGYNQTKQNDTVKTGEENEIRTDSVSSQIISIETIEEAFQKNTIWNCEDTGVVVFQQFQPDTFIMDFDYIPFDVHESYKINGLKLIFGYYKASDKGEFSPYDSETDYGHRLLCFNEKNQLVFRSCGHMDTYLFAPHFYISPDRKQVVILCQEGTEYYWGADAFLMDQNNIYHLGLLNVEQYSEYEENVVPITSVTNIKRINSALEFTFGIDSFIFDPGGKDEKLVTGIKYVYKDGKLTMESLTE